jgi:RNA polymerase sigma-70 factor (ECF subfamily)
METVTAENPEAIDQLLQRCLQSEPSAQRQLYEQFHDRCYRLILGFVSPADAADVLQKSFLRLFQKLSQYRNESSFATWFFRLTVNECLQHLRQLRRKQFATLDYDPVDHAPDHETMSEHRELLTIAMDRLDEDLRTIFVLREVQQHSYAQIAALLQINEGTVASRLSRARHELKQILVELGWEPRT